MDVVDSLHGSELVAALVEVWVCSDRVELEFVLVVLATTSGKAYFETAFLPNCP